MKVDKQLRRLLLRQSETVMLSPTSCMYFGKKYVFEQVTQDELFEQNDQVLKLLDKKSWARRTINRLFGDRK